MVRDEREREKLSVEHVRSERIQGPGKEKNEGQVEKEKQEQGTLAGREKELS